MRKVHEDGKETKYAWDTAGRLHRRQWARGVTNTWTHDPATGDLTGLTHSDDTFDVAYANHDVFGPPGSVTEIRGVNSATTTLEYNLLSGSPTETHPSNHPYLPNLKVEARADDQRGRPTGHLVKTTAPTCTDGPSATTPRAASEASKATTSPRPSPTTPAATASAPARGRPPSSPNRNPTP